MAAACQAERPCPGIVGERPRPGADIDRAARSRSGQHRTGVDNDVAARRRPGIGDGNRIRRDAAQRDVAAGRVGIAGPVGQRDRHVAGPGVDYASRHRDGGVACVAVGVDYACRRACIADQGNVAIVRRDAGIEQDGPTRNERQVTAIAGGVMGGNRRVDGNVVVGLQRDGRAGVQRSGDEPARDRQVLALRAGEGQLIRIREADDHTARPGACSGPCQEFGLAG